MDKIIVFDNYYIDDDDGSGWYKLYAGGRLIFCDFCGEPEDNTYFRDHDQVLKIMELCEMFYQYGKKGKEVEFRYLEDCENE